MATVGLDGEIWVCHSIYDKLYCSIDAFKVENVAAGSPSIDYSTKIYMYMLLIIVE